MKIKRSILYDHFSARPKHLDPVRSYASNEYQFLGQIYEPPLQYHFLKRPYELTTLAAAEMPTVTFLDTDGNELAPSVDPDQIAWSVYRITIKPGIQYQPHPAFAKDDQGQYFYHSITADDLDDIYTLNDFTETGSRELIADDYVYEIKRMAHPATHSPIASLMSEYIVGLRELSKDLRSDYKAEEKPFIDLTKVSMEGVKVNDRYTYEIKLKGKYHNSFTGCPCHFSRRCRGKRICFIRNREWMIKIFH